LMLSSEYAGAGAAGKAAEYYERALAAAVMMVISDPADAEGYYWLGRVYREQGENEPARRAFEQALAIEPGRGKYILALRSVSDSR